ncbi:hypothetical protein J2741_000322 [Methanolinea mesophila]|uniref:hypothetical protein n=1 Tax=Methanolinea mesophila TaxID=547055 RepID=UPI001AE579B0|nr:hypothetical protein [Methanolinea mesophila]MBP1927775.1 hypothetical protein [Methanolinea mesophila]
MRMHRNIPVILVFLLSGALLFAGCSTIPHVPTSAPSQGDPIVGAWISHQSDSTVFYRFWGNGTFSAWSDTGDIHPKYSFQYYGQWEPGGLYTFTTEGAHIGYGEVTALAIRRTLTIVYDPLRDTFSIKEQPGQVFSRISSDPDSPVR